VVNKFNITHTRDDIFLRFTGCSLVVVFGLLYVSVSCSRFCYLLFVVCLVLLAC
jgi:hypothetical protein